MILFDRPWFKKIFLVTTLFSLLVGLQFVGRHLQDQLAWPEDFIAQVDVVEIDGVHEPSQVSTLNYFWLQRASRKLKSLNSFFSLTGLFLRPLSLEIDTVNSLRYDIAEDKVAIGLEVLKSSGQLERSILKAWILQNTQSSASKSALRQEVTADLLYGFFNGQLDLEDPVLHKSVNFLEIKNDWTEWLLPLDRFCKTAWRPLEMLTICESLRSGPSSLSSAAMMARPLIGSLVWSRYLELNWSDRENFVREFAATIQEARSSPAASRKLTDSSWPRVPAEWRLFIESEARALVPSPAQVPELPKNEALALWKTSQGWFLLPSGLPVAPSLLSQLNVKNLIWESCEQPSIEQLLTHSSFAQRILFVKNCGIAAIHYDLYLKGSVQNFAAANPQVQFILFHRPSLVLFSALEESQPVDLVSWVLESPRPPWQLADSYLGLSQAKLQKGLQTYSVDGSVEAIQYFRR
jgi:hypothetical protein